MATTVTAKLKYLHITPRKTRFVANVIQGLPVNEAEARLMLLARRSAKPLLKFLRSTVQDAKNNFKLEAGKLFIKEVRVDQGPKSRRWTPRARGSASTIEKKTCHVTLVLGVSDVQKPPRYTITKPIKKKKIEKTGKKEKAHEEAAHKPEAIPPRISHKTDEDLKKVQSVSQPGVFKKMFRRKSI